MDSLKRVLYVDDDPDLCALARLALETLGGLQVTVCETGDEALREIAANPPDLVVLDVDMPGLDGPDTLAAVTRTPGQGAIPAVFVTAHTDPAQVRRLRVTGVLDVLRKPFDPRSFADQIKTLWNEHRSPV